MEKLIAQKVNLDYEAALFEKPFPQELLKTWTQRLEPLFFFNDQRILASHQAFSENFLSSIEKLTGTKPQYTYSPNFFENWWGQLIDKPLEKKLNSKDFSWQVAQSQGWNDPLSRLCHSHTEAFEHLKAHPQEQHWCLKKFDSVAGKGVFFIQQNSKLPAAPFILEPHHQRLMDLGAFYQRGTSFFHLNLIDQKGVFRGIHLFKNTQSFFDHLIQHFGAPMATQFEQGWSFLVQTILECLQDSPLQAEFGVDSYLYRSPQGPRLQPCCEINFRKTVGFCVHALGRLLHSAGTWRWLNTTEKPKNHQDLPSKMILTSPLSHSKVAAFISSSVLANIGSTRNKIGVI